MKVRLILITPGGNLCTVLFLYLALNVDVRLFSDLLLGVRIRPEAPDDTYATLFSILYHPKANISSRHVSHVTFIHLS